MTPEDEEKYGISPFDDELQIGDKIRAWQRAEIERLAKWSNLLERTIIESKAHSPEVCEIIASTYRRLFIDPDGQEQ